MIVCEHGFEEEDPKREGYSRHEVDFYAWIPSKWWSEVPNHRLSLRKNLRTGKFEIYRFFQLTGKERVIFEGELEEALIVANRERNHFHGEWMGEVGPDRVCRHKYPEIDRFFCPEARRVGVNSPRFEQ